MERKVLQKITNENNNNDNGLVQALSYEWCWCQNNTGRYIPRAHSNTKISGHLNTSRKFDTSVYLSALVKPLKH